MSILVGNIRLPLGAADAEALEAAAKKCGLSMRELCGAHIYRASIDARRGKITRVLSVLLDLAETQREEAVVARVGKNDVRLKPAQQPVPTGTAHMQYAHRLSSVWGRAACSPLMSWQTAIVRVFLNAASRWKAATAR